LWRRKVADSFKQIAGLVSSNTAIPTLMGKILGSLNKILPCRAAAIVVVNDTVSPDADDRFKVVKCFGVNKSKLDQLINDRTDLRVTLEFVLNSDKPLIRRPTTPRGPLGEALGYPIEYSSIAAPMKAGNDPLGVLLLAHPEPGRYGTEAGLIASTFANNAAVAIQNIDLYRSAQEQAWIANVLFKISELADSSESEFDFQCRLSRLFPLLVGLEACYLFDFDNEGKTYSFRAGYAKDEKSVRFSKRIRGEQLIDAPILLNKSLAKRYGLESLINLRNQDYYLFPMQSSTRTIGLILLSRKRSRAVSVQGSDETIGTLQRWVNQIAISMENLHLNDAEEDQAYISNALLYFAGLAFRPGKPESSFPQLQAGFKLLLGLDDAMVIDDTNKSPSLVKIEGIAETMFMTVQSIEAFINQSRLKSDITALYSPQNNKSLILSPMVTGNESYGYILLQGTKFEQEMEEKRLELIRSVSHQFAAALQNQALIDESEELNRIDQEIQLARNIQTSYLPDSIPQVAGWNISASWEPARQVGGDFFDVFKLGDQKIAIVIADVSGKGIPAALNMTVARTLIRSFASPDRSPGRVLELVNNALIREDDSGSFTTAVYGILDVEHGIFHYSNAGHPHPKHVCQARSCIATMEASGMALGVMAENNYEDVAVYLESGDSLLLFTDGVSDTQSEAGNSFGDLRIDQALRDVANSGENLINRVTTKLKRFRRNASPFDDVTMVEIKRD